MPVRSKLLAHRLDNGSAFTSVYTVPSGHRTVLKQLTLVTAPVDGFNWQLWAIMGGAAYLLHSMTTTVITSQQLPFWVVLNAGDSLAIATNVQSASEYSWATLSGAELVL